MGDGNIGSLRCESTPLYPSSFSVVAMSTVASKKCLDTCGTIESSKCGRILHFGPNELFHIRQLIKEDASVGDALSLQQWDCLLQLSCSDCLFVVTHMWQIRNALFLEATEKNNKTSEWIEKLKSSFLDYSYFSSLSEFCLIREKIVSLFLSLKCPLGNDAALSLYLISSYTYGDTLVMILAVISLLLHIIF